MKLFDVRESGYRAQNEDPVKRAYVVAGSPHEALMLFIAHFPLLGTSFEVSEESQTLLLSGRLIEQ